MLVKWTSVNQGPAYKRCIIPFVVVDIEEDQLRPQVSFFDAADHLWYVNSRPEQAEMFHDTLGMVLGESIAQGREQSHVS
jgi:hypothetical protein